EGKTYQLWLVTAQAKISAGVFDPSSEEAAGSVAVPTDAGAVVAAAVTPEPAGGSPQPTGKIILLGKI
ncbi:MAG TPA: anti-sigma factor, partial [Candidatus Polarisedimenticolia bacterium]|nr:anti-sigma factor [Candidatus Polarisedimenticolia bacterium]